jgi:UDP-2,3-diacylglucosamine pyrophosphatase LpxH
MEKRAIDILVFSDVHLGTYGCRAKELSAYLQSINPRLIIINGDFIDGWQFNKKFFPKTHIQIIQQILQFVNNGTQVIYIAGNHDEFLRKYGSFNLGCFRLCNKLLLKIENKIHWFFHGDVFDSTTKGTTKIIAKLGGYGYDVLIMLNTAVNFCLKLMNREKMSLSKLIKNSVKKAVIWINNFEQTAAELAIENKYDVVICGHIHQPQKRMVRNKHGSVLYLNSGDWIENLSSLEYYNNSWHIYYHQQKSVNLNQYKNAKIIAEEELVFNTVVV